eukprot:TRINITY_DN30826_c0_g1_i1.p1 TRINITY_DN30826_c0_g1~~TRINITY_DN30826_c0_g1_i1.p1  ORF type:complete len:127 (-),score=10.53 TRINITY_DN30826_c0_g1_i1:624-1004(-)
MYDSFNRNFMNEIMIDSSFTSGNDWFFENGFVCDSLDWGRNNFDLCSDGINNRLDMFLECNCSSWNVDSFCVYFVGYSSSLSDRSIVNNSIRSVLNLYINMFSFDDWLNNSFVMNSSTWNINNFGG